MDCPRKFNFFVVDRHKEFYTTGSLREMEDLSGSFLHLPVPSWKSSLLRVLGEMAKKKSLPNRTVIPNPQPVRTCIEYDHFCLSANQIDELGKSDPSTARSRWNALKESAETDDSGSNPPTLLDAAKIAFDIKHPVVVLLKAKIFLSVKECHEFGRTMPELKDALPLTLEAYQRTFKDRFHRVHNRYPHSCGTKKRNRFAITYAEFLHLEGAPGIDLIGELEIELTERLEAL